MERGPHRGANIIERPRFYPQQSPTSDDPVGCGLAGCLGGVIFGLLGGAGLLIVTALLVALFATLPAVAPTPAGRPDLRVTVTEGFLNRFVEPPAEGAIEIDILPNNQVAVVGTGTLEAFGFPAPVQVTGIFQLQLEGQTLSVRLVETQVADFALPPELNDFFANDIPVVNQDLQMMLAEISAALGVPVRVINISTANTQIQLDLREVQ